VQAAGFREPFSGFSSLWGGGATLSQALRPFPQYGSVWEWNGTYGSSIYHSFQARAERRFRRGLGFLMSYTLSKAIDTVPIYGGAAPDANNVAAAKGPADTDSRHRFSASFNYELPFGPGHAYLANASGVTAALVAGWQVNGIVSLVSGVPFTPFVSADVAGTGRPGSQWPDRTCSGDVDDPTPDHWFDATCFKAAAPGTFGNGGRNTLVGPGRSTVDLSVFKQFSIHEGHRLQFRAEVFNLFNHANFGQPNATIDAPLTVGRITTTITDSRQVQLALKYLF